MITTLSKNVYRAGSAYADLDSSHIKPEVAPPVLSVSSNVGAVTPSDNGAGGTFTAQSATSWLYAPPNESKTIILSASDSVETDNVTLTNWATLPLQPQFGFEWDTPTNSQVIIAKDGSPRFRRAKNRTGIWTLSFLKRTIMDVSLMKSFEFFHDIDKEFYFFDDEIQQSFKARLDSSVKVRTDGPNYFQMSCIVKIYQLSTLTIPTVYA